MEFTDAQIEELLQVYCRLFPREEGRAWNEVAAYWDFARSRPWSYLTTDFHAVTPKQLRAFDAARRAWRPSDDRVQDGHAIACLARNHGCGHSVGVTRFTDSTLHVTVTPDTRELIVLVGHDWYPILPREGVNYDYDGRPLEIYPLLDSPDPRWGAGYARGIPSAERFRRARIGLLYLNLVPDYRPPNTSAEGQFPFEQPTAFGYPHCAKGLRAAVKLASAVFRICHIITWSSHVWKALREFTEDRAVSRLSIMEAARRGGADGFAWPLNGHVLRIHPFPHTVPGRQHLLWSPELWRAYEEMWNRLLNGNEDEKGGW